MSGLNFNYHFFKDGLVIEQLEAKTDSEAFSKLHDKGYDVRCFEVYVRFCKIDKHYDICKIK